MRILEVENITIKIGRKDRHRCTYKPEVIVHVVGTAALGISDRAAEAGS
jgi:hypothetical protein